MIADPATLAADAPADAAGEPSSSPASPARRPLPWIEAWVAVLALAAVAALLGLSRAADALACGLAVAVVYALVNLAIRGRLNATLRAVAVQWLNLIYLRDPTPAVLPGRRTIPLAIPILAGLLLCRLPW